DARGPLGVGRVHGDAVGALLLEGERHGHDPAERLGRRRWVIERTMSWLTGYRRLNHRYERHPRNYLAFLGLAAAICCYKRYVRLTT
ncbi:transposase, partial [Streptomyces sp. NPDC001940]